MIAELVWDMNFESDTNVVDVAIRRLRAKLDNPYPVKLLHTVRAVAMSSTFGIRLLDWLATIILADRPR